MAASGQFINKPHPEGLPERGLAVWVESGPRFDGESMNKLNRIEPNARGVSTKTNLPGDRGREEVARLAYLNWEKDGGPHGEDQKYWLEAERQIQATRHLLASELGIAGHTPDVSVAATSVADGAVKKGVRLQRK